MAITVSQPTATRDSNTSYYVAIDNPVIFTFTAGAGETQVIINIYDGTATPPEQVNGFDIVLSFDSSNQVVFDAAPYLRSLLNNTNDFNYTSNSASDTNASLLFYLEYQEFPIPSPSVYTQTNEFTAIKAAKQIGNAYGANMAEYVDFTTQVSLQDLNTPSKTLPFWVDYPFSLEGVLNEEVKSYIITEYEQNAIQQQRRYNTVAVNQLINHFRIPLAAPNQNKVEFYLDDTELLQFTFDIVTTNTSTGSSSNNQFALPLESSGTYNFTVNWGDGNEDDITTWNQSETTHTYASTGTYTVTIEGTCTGWRFADTGDKLKITDVTRWGNVRLGNSGDYFNGCTNLDLSGVLDTLDLTGTTTFARAFLNCTSLTTIGEADTWDTSSLTTISRAFEGCTNFNADISAWDTSSLTGSALLRAFQNCSSFNQNVGLWNITSSVTSIAVCFNGCTVFNQSLNSWDVSGVTSMDSAFLNATAFNGNVASWNVSNVTTFNQLFRGCSNFNQNISGWNVSSVSIMTSAFNGCTNFNQNLNSWNTASLTNTSNTFRSCTSLDQNFAGWDVTKLTNATSMFNGCTLSTSNYDSTLVGWEAQAVQNNVTFDGGFSTYTSAGAGGTARAALIADHSWTITDGGGV